MWLLWTLMLMNHCLQLCLLFTWVIWLDGELLNIRENTYLESQHGLFIHLTKLCCKKRASIDLSFRTIYGVSFIATLQKMFYQKKCFKRYYSCQKSLPKLTRIYTTVSGIVSSAVMLVLKMWTCCKVINKLGNSWSITHFASSICDFICRNNRWIEATVSSWGRPHSNT